MYLQGLHPRLITEGFDLAKTKALDLLEEMKQCSQMEREMLVNVARTSLRTKVSHLFNTRVHPGVIRLHCKPFVYTMGRG